LSLRQRLWDAGYAMAEPFIKMPPPEKILMVVLLAVMLYAWTAKILEFDPRIVIGTTIGRWRRSTATP